MWLSLKCTPQSSYANNGKIARAERDIKKHEIEERGAAGPPTRYPRKVIVPAGAVLTYKNRLLTVKLTKATLQKIWTSKLQVRDDIAFGPGVLFEAKRNANRSFVGYGKPCNYFLLINVLFK
ncbi:PREDICTED: uncharacterized protein LOC109591959, partial [Amphimedon queenslandica]|uniref:Uncharacterized protein n=1 Tax=Amphimedon queenslandica TaxID=400682 RepID=A0AAN0K1F9_AMPQE